MEERAADRQVADRLRGERQQVLPRPQPDTIRRSSNQRQPATNLDPLVWRIVEGVFDLCKGT